MIAQHIPARAAFESTVHPCADCVCTARPHRSWQPARAGPAPLRAGTALQPGQGCLQRDGTRRARLSYVPFLKTPLKQGEMSNGHESSPQSETLLCCRLRSGPERERERCCPQPQNGNSPAEPPQGNFRKCSHSSAELFRSRGGGKGGCARAVSAAVP